jgi:hypothetical protein
VQQILLLPPVAWECRPAGAETPCRAYRAGAGGCAQCFANGVVNGGCKDGYEKSGGDSQYVCNSAGHWVVGTRSSSRVHGGDSGQDLICLGQTCGAAPHGFAPSVTSLDWFHPSEEKDDQVWPFVKFDACTDSMEEKALYYSDNCAKTPACHCTGTCYVGYTADGTSTGVTERTFQCEQDSNQVYFLDDTGTQSPANQNNNKGGPKGALVCKAVTCGDVMTLSELKPYTDFLVNTDNPVAGPDKTYHRCGAHNGATGDSAGEMRFDRDSSSHHNECVASCKKGYTEDPSSRSVSDGGSIESADSGQIFECGSDGNFNGALKCTIVHCPSTPLEQISQQQNQQAHANASTWQKCKSQPGNQFGRKCSPQCSTGFTSSKIDGKPTTLDMIKPYECVAIPRGAFPNGDKKFGEEGTWTYDGKDPNGKGSSKQTLQCEAVRCQALTHEDTRPRFTKNSKDDHSGGRKGDVDVNKGGNYKNTSSTDGIYDRAGGPLCTSSQFLDTTDTPLGDGEGIFQDTCRFECLNSWYPTKGASDWRHRRFANYTCSEALGSGAAGAWCPGPDCTSFSNEVPLSEAEDTELVCEEGKLSALESRLRLDISKRVQEQSDWPRPGEYYSPSECFSLDFTHECCVHVYLCRWHVQQHRGFTGRARTRL